LFVNDVLEIDDDGIPRTVTVVVDDEVTFTPPIEIASVTGMRVDIWGTGVTDMNVDLKLKFGSPCIDSADDTISPDVDIEDNSRYDDLLTDNCTTSGNT